jgi:hypothetical protein
MRQRTKTFASFLGATLFSMAVGSAEVMPLGGTWLVEDGVAPDAMPEIQ